MRTGFWAAPDMKKRRFSSIRSIKSMTPTSFDGELSAQLETVRGKHLLLALSGGKDSLALLDFAAEQAHNLRLTLSACHVHHGIREEADVDAQFCEQTCAERGIPFLLKRVAVPQYAKAHGLSLEHAARILRYQALSGAQQETGADLILTAHTRDDQLESFFVDLATGASLFTLGGVRRVTDTVFRPMLNLSTDDVQEYLARRGLIPVYDATNSDTRYVRNRVRADILPVIRSHGDASEQTIFRLQEDSRRFRAYMEEKTVHAVLSATESITVLDRPAVDAMAELEREFLLLAVFSRYFRCTRAHLGAVLQDYDTSSSRRVHLSGGFRFEQSVHTLRVFHERMVQPFTLVKSPDAHAVPLEGVGKTVTFSGELIGCELVIRSRRDGDRVGRKKLKDLFINKGVDLFLRDRAVIVENNGQIIFAEYCTANPLVQVTENQTGRIGE